MRAARFCLGIAMICSGVACGYTDAGVGTRTLEVNANMHYNWQTDNTQADVWLNRVGTAVANANILLLDADSHLHQIVEQAAEPGHFSAVLVGYPRRLQLSVRAGDDALACQIEGPGRHLIASPAPGTVIGYGTDLPVKWSTEDGIRADSVTVTLADVAWSQRVSNDQGYTAVPTQVLVPGVHTVTVERRTQVVPSGGAGHSHVDMAYAVSTPFQVRAVR